MAEEGRLFALELTLPPSQLHSSSPPPGGTSLSFLSLLSPVHRTASLDSDGSNDLLLNDCRIMTSPYPFFPRRASHFPCYVSTELSFYQPERRSLPDIAARHLGGYPFLLTLL